MTYIVRAVEHIKRVWTALRGEDHRRALVYQCDYEMASGALEAIHRLLDNGGIPRGTFADDHVRNLVALYNQRGDRIAQLEALCERTAANHALYRAALSDTVKKYPKTDPMALVTFAIKLGVLTVPLDAADIQWVEDQIATIEKQ